MIAQISLVLLFVVVLVFFARQYIRNEDRLAFIREQLEFLPYWSFFLGIYYMIRCYGRVGHKGVAGVRILVRNLCFYPYSETGIFYSWGGFLYPYAYVATSRTEVLKAVLGSKQRVDKGMIYEVVDAFAHGLIGLDKVKWNKHRKILNPTFHHGMLQNFVPVLSQQGQKLVSAIDRQIQDGPTVIHDYTEIVSERIMAMLLETIMGTNEEDVDPQFRVATRIVDRLTVNRIQNPLKLFKPLYLLTQEGRTYHKSLEFMRSEARRLVKIRTEQLKDGDTTGCNMVLIDALMKVHMKDPVDVTIDDVIGEVLTFLVAGWDTTTWTASFTTQLIGEYPQVQERIHQEIDSQLDGVTDDHLLTMEDISKLKYLECVINESLRFNPLVLTQLRHLKEDLEFEMDGKKRFIKAGSDIPIDHELIHRSPRYWKNPDRFIPERFLPENSQGRDPFAFLPFSQGPRNCIGKTFAMCEEKIILAQIFRKFKVTAVDPWDKIEMDLSGIARRTLKPIKLVFEHRKVQK